MLPGYPEPTTLGVPVRTSVAYGVVANPGQDACWNGGIVTHSLVSERVGQLKLKETMMEAAPECR